MDNWLVVVLVLGGLVVVSLLITLVVLPLAGDFSLGGATVAHLVLDGPIVSAKSGGFFGGPSVVASSVVVKQIQDADDDPLIDAILLEINSPGGTVVPSKEIARAVKDAEKPTVAWIRDVGASGGYWIASSADYIVADSLSITGSIGVIASGFGLKGLLDMYNVTYRQLTSGKYKDAGTPFREMTSEEKDLFQVRLDMIHDEFIQAVAENRNFSMKHSREVGNGIFYLGRQALELGLVDELGGKPEVKAYLKKTLDVDDVKLEEVDTEPGLLDLLMGASESFSFNLGQGIAQGFQQSGGIRT